MAHDVFISYTIADKAAADAVCHRLEEAGIRCWFAPRDVGFGDRGASIVEAIGAAKLFVMILSAAANASPNVLDEVVTALDAGATVIPFRIEDIRPTGALRLRLSRLHWLDALSSPLDQHIDRLIEIAKRILPAAEAEGEAAAPRQEEQARQSVGEPLPLLHVAEESHLRTVSPEPQRATEPTKLEQAGESLAAAPPPPLQPPSPVSPPAPKLINRAVAAGALAVLALGGGAALLFFSKNEISPTPAPPSVVNSEQMEFDDAMVSDTITALETFVKKNPNSPLVKTAKREREKIAQRMEEAAKREAEQAAAAAKRKADQEAAEATKRKADQEVAEATKRKADQEAAEAAKRKLDHEAAAAAQPSAPATRPEAPAPNPPQTTTLTVQRAPVTDCDRLAADVEDPDRIAGVKGVRYTTQINIDLALPACVSGTKAYPAERRLAYQLGLVLYAAKRFDEARKVLGEADKAGSTSARDLLGRMYLDGEGVAIDKVEAVRLFRQAADLGNSDAVNDLGYSYAHGEGVTKDQAKAVQLYRQAADLGNASAMNNLGYMYENGQGVTKDQAKAVQLYRQAADLGNASAMNNLGGMYENGEGVTKNIAKARSYYQMAADGGDSNAKDALKRLSARPKKK
jgi:TPR repeat protein